MVVEDERLTARLHQPGIAFMAPVLRARLVQEDRGARVEGEIMRTELVGLLVWLVVVSVLVGAGAQAVAAGNTGAVVLVTVMVAGLAAVTPCLRRAASRHQREAAEQLEAALLARFAIDD